MARATQPAVLILEDGTVFHGRSCGQIGTTTGEIAFNTAMTGYQEVFTDPSYFGQILVMATAHIGNYGVHPDETESESCKVSGIVIKKFSDVASRSGDIVTLQQYLERDNKVGICEVDTRSLVRHIRTSGAMNAIISSETSDIAALKSQLAAVPSMAGLELSSHVTCNTAYDFGSADAELRIAVIDFGVKRSILRCLAERGAALRVFPMKVTAEEVLAWKPDGILFSNGPGDPSAMTRSIALVRNLVSSGIPGFGICLGHQLIGLSQGLLTEKMFNGHRGINHPVKNLRTGKSEITSQNHGFVISQSSVADAKGVEVTHIHLNDGTIAGIRLTDRPVFSVQYHPEACAGPHDSRYLFDEFITVVRENKSV